jgi:hypothetical protein
MEMDEFKPHRPKTSDSLADQKLKLEIIELQKRTRWQLTPVITALISVAGLVVSVILFGSQQAAEQEKNRIARELERRTALQNQISSEIDEILRFPGDPKVTISRVAFLLADIQSMLDSPITPISVDPKENPPAKLADVLPKYDDHLTRSLVFLVRDECDLSRKARDASVARAVSQYWTRYADYLAPKPMEALNYILWKYTKALGKFHDENPGYLESFAKTQFAIEPGARYQRQPNEDLRYGHLVDLSDGFKEHLKILCKEPQAQDAKDLRKGRFEEFQINLSNPIVSDFLLKAKNDNEFCEGVVRKEK